ncbi:unnamed protein product (macronuclear) [Paramecium tetraurelia]|uniref:Uncharacterized protein n=1 Tax=Paramecium tetraurelia TaxID=5888 RepID=A0E5H0_PARTE|nr:uncharacterized protein GSPATT00003398001 [Paramecium tetraurelia]CAK90537.1 unnamed protein product [Paramecium tetraurelia]|eukprot:XP_001457934.1 hypothetical protein (macronuclear) [Paramecium tetraurelia strain d4-2]
MFQNTKHLRKVLFSTAIQNGTQIQDFASIDPATLIKMGLRKNSLELFNSLRDRLNFCKYEMITDYRNLMTYVQRSHVNQFIDKQSYERVIATQFSENQINSHMIWLSYIIMEEKDYMQPLRNMESVWYKNVLYLNIKQIHAVLTFYEKFNLYISERTLYEMLKIIHKNQQKYQKEVDILYHCLQIIEKQSTLLKNDPLFLDLQNNISSKVKETLTQAKILENTNFFLIHPLQDLSIIKEGLKGQSYQLTSQQMKNMLTIIQNTLFNNPSYSKTELNEIINILQQLFSQNNTLSNKFQLSLLQKLLDKETDLSKFDPQVDYLKINDLQFLMKARLLTTKDEKSSDDLKHYIFKFLLKTMQNRKIYCVDFDHFYSINKILVENQEYSMLLKPYREYLGVYSFLY